MDYHDDDFIMLQTIFGNLKPVICGYSYQYKSHRPEHTIYLCTEDKKGCRARIKLSNVDHRPLPHATRPHNHLPLTKGQVQALASRQKMTREIKQHEVSFIILVRSIILKKRI